MLKYLHRLDEKLKGLTKRKDQLQKESKAKVIKIDSVKSQIDQLMKVCLSGKPVVARFLQRPILSGCIRDSEESGRNCTDCTKGFDFGLETWLIRQRSKSPYRLHLLWGSLIPMQVLRILSPGCDTIRNRFEHSDIRPNLLAIIAIIIK